MIDLADLRANPRAYKKAAKDKGLKVSIDDFLDLDKKRLALVPAVEEMRAKKNEVSKKVPQMKGDEKEKALAEMKNLSVDLKGKEEELKKVEEEWKRMQLFLPQIPLESTPIGKDESDNVEIEKWGDPTIALGITPPKEPKDHIALGEALNIIDIPGGVKVAGAGSYVLKGDGARLEQAVLRYTVDHLVAKGFTLISPPVLASYETLMGMGHFPGSEEQTYAVGVQTEKEGAVKSDQLFLAGTSEACTDARFIYRQILFL